MNSNNCDKKESIKRSIRKTGVVVSLNKLQNVVLEEKAWSSREKSAKKITAVYLITSHDYLSGLKLTTDDLCCLKTVMIKISYKNTFSQSKFTVLREIVKQDRHTMSLFRLTILLSAFIVSCVAQQQHDPNYCYVTDPIRSQLNRFSSRTGYEIIRSRAAVNPNISCKLE